jgi:hypothetical protein
MKHTIGTIFCLLCFCYAQSQISENFSDGNLSSNPNWEGDTIDFKINLDEQLQLNAAEAGRSLIYTVINQTDSLQWELFFKLDFSPSSSNQLRVFLLNDSTNVNNGNAIFFEIGETGSKDGLKLFHRNEGKDSLIQTVLDSQLSNAFELQLKIQLTQNQYWKIDAALNSQAVNHNFNFQHPIQNISQAHFAIETKYSSTRKDKFYFDDLFIGPISKDTTPAKLIDWVIRDSVSIDLFYNEAISDSMEFQSIFTLNDLHHPILQMKDEEDQSLLHLIFQQAFEPGIIQNLTIENIYDLDGNVTSLEAFEFVYFLKSEAASYELIINEIMADPIPSLILPEGEYIELYNNSSKYLEMGDYYLQKDQTKYEIGEMVMKPKEYLILCKASDLNAFQIYGNAIGLDRFPSLRNSGDHLMIVNESDQIIHQIQYEVDWHQDPFFENGGWSLELINPENICLGAQNWSTSTSPIQGSPGRVNYIVDTTNLQLPRIKQVLPSENALTIFFDGEIAIPMHQDFEFSPSLGIVNLSAGTNDQIFEIKFDQILQENQVYQLITKSSINDCKGRSLIGDTLQFGLASEIGYGDLIINEILFDPVSGSEDYLELYNRSEKILDINELLILNESHGRFEFINTTGFIEPKAYVLLTEDIASVSDNYHVDVTNTFIQNDLPAFDNEMGKIIIYKRNLDSLAVIDSFTYHEDMHSPFLENRDGVSLERINPEQNYWQSASGQHFFGTPGYQNSQFVLPISSANEISIVPNVFSPNGDAYNDVCSIKFNLKQAARLDIKIFDEHGILKKHLFEQQWIGTEEELIWDGRLDNGQLGNLGIYILLIELLNEDGNSEKHQFPVVLAYPLE